MFEGGENRNTAGLRPSPRSTATLVQQGASGWRLFFCQREAAETIIYLKELRIPGRSIRTGFKKFDLPDEDIQQLLWGQHPDFYQTPTDYYPTIEPKQDPSQIAFADSAARWRQAQERPSSWRC